MLLLAGNSVTNTNLDDRRRQLSTLGRTLFLFSASKVQSMPDETAPGHGVEKAVYYVGGLGLGLFGIQQLATTFVDIYSGTYSPSGRALDISPPTWAGWIVGLSVGFLFLLGGLYLLFRNRRAGRMRSSGAATPTAASP